MKLTADHITLLTKISEAEGPFELALLSKDEFEQMVDLYSEKLVRSHGSTHTELTDEGHTALQLAGFKFPEPPAPEPKPKPKMKVVHHSEGATPEAAQLAKVSTSVRQTVVGLLKKLSPEDFEAYRALKFEGVAKGERPSLEQSQKAYLFAFKRFLELTYKKSGL